MSPNAEKSPASPAAPADAPPATQKRNRRPGKPRKPRPLTPPQVEAVQIVGECRGNLAQAARRLSKARKTVEQSYKAGLAKLGKIAVRRGDRLFPRDARGQGDVAEIDDARRDGTDEDQARKFRKRG